MNWQELDPFLLSESWSSWVESGVWSLLIDNPVEVIGGGDVGLLAPGDFVGLVVLAISPCVVSLSVW